MVNVSFIINAQMCIRLAGGMMGTAVAPEIIVNDQNATAKWNKSKKSKLCIKKNTDTNFRKQSKQAHATCNNFGILGVSTLSKTWTAHISISQRQRQRQWQVLLLVEARRLPKTLH